MSRRRWGAGLILGALIAGQALGGEAEMPAAILLGPFAGILIMATVLMVQCLVFADGGLTALGVRVLSSTALPDDLDLVTAAFASALETADLVVSTGGLGPTPDDLTREAIAAACGLEPFVEGRPGHPRCPSRAATRAWTSSRRRSGAGPSRTSSRRLV